jgi:aerobic C4-dicarboxylate transport protein
VIRPVAEHLFCRGAGFNVHQSTIDTKASEGCTSAAQHQNTVELLTHIIPDDVICAFATLERLSG